ncbi:hypothetical protein SANTM175S_06957 [Streptomyces antimycoticus]
MVGEVVAEGLYRIGRQDPAPIGAEAGLAVPRPDGGVEIYTASTDPHADRDLAAACFGLEPERVKVVVTGVPGAMGEREDPGMQLPLGLLALRTGHPVKLAATREESFLGHAHRHPTLLRYRHHADAQGKLVKVEASGPAWRPPRPVPAAGWPWRARSARRRTSRADRTDRSAGRSGSAPDTSAGAVPRRSPGGRTGPVSPRAWRAYTGWSGARWRSSPVYDQPSPAGVDAEQRRALPLAAQRQQDVQRLLRLRRGGAAASRRATSRATVSASKRSRIDSSVASAARAWLASLEASSEWPPAGRSRRRW